MFYLHFKMRERGFTLIELLIVIAIILILIAIALPNFLEAQVRARVVNAKGGLRAMETAFNSHLIDWGCIPADFNDSKTLIAECRVKGDAFGQGGACSRLPDRNFLTDGGLDFDTTTGGNGRDFRGTFYANGMHCPLTTPIRYLPPESTYDIFSDGTVPLGYDSRAWNEKGQIYYGAFWSAGPDRIAGHWQRGHADFGVDIYGDGCIEGLPYNATNGTTSLGELWGVVGDWAYVFRPDESPCGSAQREYVIQKTY